MIVSYDSAVARQAEARLRGTAAHLQQTLNDLTGYVSSVCSGWEGDEKVQYADIQRRWTSAAGEIHQILDRITVSLGANTDAVDVMRSTVRSTLAG